MRRLTVLAALTAASFVAACQSTGPTTAGGGSSTAPLPDDVFIEEPGPEVAPEYAAYSGRWSGRWDGSLDGHLVVERVTPPTADVIYSWGRNNTVREPGWNRVTAEFQDDELFVPLSPGITARYEMREDGRLRGQYRNLNRGWNATAVLTRTQ